MTTPTGTMRLAVASLCAAVGGAQLSADSPVSLLQLPTSPGTCSRCTASLAQGELSAARAEGKTMAGLQKCPDVASWAAASVAEQLAPWQKKGYTAEMVERAFDDQKCKPRGRYLIEVKDGKVVKGGNLGWGQYIARAIKEWPFDRSELRDFQVVGDRGDWPCSIKGDPEAGPEVMAPAFANSNNGNFYEVLMPVQQRIQFDKHFHDNRDEALLTGNKVPWKQRKDVAVWRGVAGCGIGCGKRGAAFSPNRVAENCIDSNQKHAFMADSRGVSWGCGDGLDRQGLWRQHPRMQLVNYSRINGKQCGIDAAFWQVPGDKAKFMKSYGVDAEDFLGDRMSDDDSAENKYIISVGNNGYADRSWRMFALGSTTMLVENGWTEWYFSLLKPHEHYLPLKEDSSDLCERLAWAREHPEEAEAIAQTGRRFVEDCMKVELVDLYVAEMVRQLGALWHKGHEQQPQ